MTTPPLQAPTDAAGRAAHGEIPGAALADRNDLDALFGPAENPVISLDTPVVVVCGSPNGSGPVAAALAQRGYTNVSHVDGGFPAWKDAGLPASDPVEAPAPSAEPVASHEPAASPEPTAPARP